MRTQALFACMLAFAAAWATYKLVGRDPDSGLWWEILLVAAASATASVGAYFLCATGYTRIGIALLLSLLIAVVALQWASIFLQASRPIPFEAPLAVRLVALAIGHAAAFASAGLSLRLRHPHGDGGRIAAPSTV